MHVDAHRLAVDEDLRGAVLVRADEDPVGVRRRAELVDLLLEELDLLLRLLEHADELLVLALGVGELLARELVAAAQRLVLGEHAVEAAAELGGVAAEEAQRVAEILDLVLQRTGRVALTLRIHRLRRPAHPWRRCVASRRARSPSCPTPNRTRSWRLLLVRPPLPRRDGSSTCKCCKAHAATGAPTPTVSPIAPPRGTPRALRSAREGASKRSQLERRKRRRARRSDARSSAGPPRTCGSGLRGRYPRLVENL